MYNVLTLGERTRLPACAPQVLPGRADASAGMRAVGLALSTAAGQVVACAGCHRPCSGPPRTGG